MGGGTNGAGAATNGSAAHTGPALHTGSASKTGSAAHTGSASNAAYARLRDLIANLDLPPGSALREADLQQQVGVGRTPLREAFQRLAHEGMLRIYPRRAIVVAKLGLPEVRQIFEARLALEPAAAALAAERITPDEASALCNLETDLRAAVDRSDVKTFLGIDQVFHRTVAHTAENPLLAEYVEHVQTLNLWLWNTYFRTHRARRSNLFGHQAIVDALLAGNGPTASAAMHDHIVNSKRQLLTGLELESPHLRQRRRRLPNDLVERRRQARGSFAHPGH
jgi:DNA-binding GntR family transcriptional regulator